MTRRFDFESACLAMLQSLGATQGNACYPWQLHTVAGVLRLRVMEDWLACRFDDVERAKSVVGPGRLNPYSGKWNWHFDAPTASEVEALRQQLLRLRVPGQTGADAVAPECQPRVDCSPNRRP